MLKTSVTRLGPTEATRLDTDDIYALSYDRLAAAADPANWPQCLPRHFLRMVDLGTNAQGWSRMIEHVTYGMVTLRTPLVFWKHASANSYFIRYELDTEADPRRVDGWVRADSGFIEVARHGVGRVRVRTRKDLAIAGTLPRLGAWMAPWLGYQALSQEFFANQAQITNPHPFVPNEEP